MVFSLRANAFSSFNNKKEASCEILFAQLGSPTEVLAISVQTSCQIHKHYRFIKLNIKHL